MRNIFLLLFFLAGITLQAQVKPAHIFDNNMVLQREKPVKVWGLAAPIEKVTVEFGGQVKYTVANHLGEWHIYLDPMSANAQPQEMKVSGKGSSVLFSNVLVGDVWILGGQSNMEFDLFRIFHGDVEVLSANFPKIRLMTIPSSADLKPQKDFERINEYDSWYERYDKKGYWFMCSPETVPTFSGLGYIFGKRLFMASQIPIGLIDVSLGGTTVEAWLKPETLSEMDENSSLLKQWNDKVTAFDPDEDLRVQIRNWEKDSAARIKEGIDPEPKPAEPSPGPALDRNFPGSSYTGMVAVIAGLTVRGVVFHQGYNNALDDARPKLYALNFKALIADWRSTFNDKDLPFGIIEFSAGGEPQTPGNYELRMIDPSPYIREGQLRAFLDLPNTGFVCSYDQQVNWYHPQKKVEAGERMARWALSTQYGFDLRWEPAICTGIERLKDRIIVTFSKPVKSSDDRPLEGFSIAGSDRHFFPGKAAYVKTQDENGQQVDDKKQIEVTNNLVIDPVEVRYAWARNPLGNLVNNDNPIIPVPLFRSDKWDYPEAPYSAEEYAAHRASLKMLRKQAMEMAGARLIREAEMNMLMVHAAKAVDDVPKRLPGIPTSASPYSDYAPYLCYPGSDKYYSFPGIRDPWVFNRAMVWLEQKDGVDGPPICYSGGESLWLSGKQQASIWRGGTITENADNSTTFSAALADEGVKLPFFTGKVDPAIMKLSIGHACTSPFQFNLEQHPKAILEVTDASAPWRFMVVLKGREGKPSYICDWKTGAGKLEMDLRSIYRILGYQGNFAHVYFLFSIVGPQDKPKSATFKLHMAGEGAVISSLPVIRTDQRQRKEGVPLACIVVDEQARKLGEGTVVVKATVNGKTYAMKESGGIWQTRVHDLRMGDHRASLEAEWLGGEKKKVAMLDVSVTDGKFIGFDPAKSLLTYDGKPMPPMAGSETGKLIYQQPDTPNESLVCGEKEWNEVIAAAKGGNLNIADRWWEGLNEKDQEKQAEYLTSCGFNLMHLSSWWHHWERTEYLDHVAPYGVERLAGTLRANRKHGVFLYFNLANHHPKEDGCVPYQQQVDAGIQKWSYSVNSGWVKTYMGYAAAFARLFSDETSLLAVSANGERDRDTRTGTLDFVNKTYDIYRAEDPNHLVITEFDTFDDPMAVTAFKPKPAGFRTYTCHDRDRPYAELNIRLIQGKYKVEMMRPHPYQSEGNFWGYLPTELHGYEGDSYTHNRDQGKLLQTPRALAHYRLLTREETYLALVYRISMCMTWGECIIEDERKVHQDVRQRVNWTQEWKPAPVAIRVLAVRDKSKEPDLFGCARLIDEPYNYEEKMNALSLETTYLWGKTPVPDGVAHVIDLNKQSSLNPAFASDGGDLPDWLKDVRPIVVPGGQTHYSWSRDSRTLLAYLPGQIPGSTIKLQGFPDGPLHYRLYDLDKKDVVATGSFQKSSALTLPEKGNSFFLLVTP